MLFSVSEWRGYVMEAFSYDNRSTLSRQLGLKREAPGVAESIWKSVVIVTD